MPRLTYEEGCFQEGSFCRQWTAGGQVLQLRTVAGNFLWRLYLLAERPCSADWSGCPSPEMPGLDLYLIYGTLHRCSHCPSFYDEPKFAVQTLFRMASFLSDGPKLSLCMRREWATAVLASPPTVVSFLGSTPIPSILFLELVAGMDAGARRT